ncbi:MAG: alpha-amylase family glycosyl hydrolase [Calditrichia bacterium]
MSHRLMALIAGLFICIFSCSYKTTVQPGNDIPDDIYVLPTSEITDVIPVVHATASEKIAIPLQDLFYAESYDLQVDAERSDQQDLNAKILNDSLFLHPDAEAEGLKSLWVNLNGNFYQIPVKVTRLVEKTFRLNKTDINSGNVTIFGEFNAWNRVQSPLILQADGSYEITLKLQPGRYQYKFFEDGREFLDPANPDSVPNGFGAFNSLLTIKPRNEHSFELFPDFFEEKADSLVLNFKYLYIRNPLWEAHPILQSALIPRTKFFIDNMAVPVDWIGPLRNLETFSLVIPKSYFIPGRLYTVRVAIYSKRFNGISSNFHQTLLKDGRIVGTETGIESNYDRVIYSLMVDRFRDGDPENNWKAEHAELDPRVNYHGGDLQGVIDALKEGYFDSLGVNTLWLSPVIQNTQRVEQEFPEPHRWFTSYHGYWPTDPEKVDSRFGDMRLLKEIVVEAGKHDSEVLLDYVANHAHRDHPWFTKHRSWFGKLDLPDGRKNLRFWDEFRLTTWFEPYLPSFDYVDSPEALDAMTENAIWWLRESGAAGFRHDAVKHIPNRFWRTLTRKIRKMDEQRAVPLFQIGETFGGYDLISSYVNNGQLNSQFNFNLFDAARNTFLRTDASFADLEKEMQKTLEVYGVNHLMGNPINSHDKVRYLSYADGDLSLDSGNAKELAWNNPPQVDNPDSYRRMRLYMAYMMTIPGVPIVYYGDEIGMTGSEDPDNRRPMRFGKQLSDNENEMLRESRKLIGIRQEHSALRYGDYHSLRADEDCLVFMRSDFNEKLVIAFNKSGKDVRAEVPFGILNSRNSGLCNLTDVRTGTQADKSTRNYTIMIPAGKWGIWKYVEAKQ